MLRLAPIFLDKGETPAKFVCGKAGRAIIDGLRLTPVARAPRAIEAEELSVVSVADGAARPHPSMPISGVSAGRILEWHADKIGQGMVLLLPQPLADGRVLGVRSMRGPQGGMIQCFVGGKAIGPAFDTYDAAKHPNEAIWPLGVLPAGSSQFEIRVVGKNPASQAFHVGLDCFRWEPQILSDDSAEGVWAGVATVRGCAYEVQNLGPAYSAGHHLWIQPSSPNAFVDIEVNLPRGGDYNLALRLTRSWDYAIVQAELDGKEIGPRVDCFSADVQRGEVVALGRTNLPAGRHILKLKAVDKNGASRGYLMGVDDLIVRAAR
jgi:hypothetical protein